MNPFLIPGEILDWRPRRFYALLDSIEPQGALKDEKATASFEAVDADQFDKFVRSAVEDAKFFAMLRIAILDVGFSRSSDMEKWGFPLTDEEPQWLELVVEESGDLPVQQFRNLFDPEPLTRYLRAPAAVPRENVLMRLEDEFSLKEVPDASPSEIERVLDSAGPIGFATVYDVGQGNWNSMCDPAGFPRLYYDFGGGIKQHSRTFPTTFQDFCSSRNPPVVLSHWDWDHWSSAQRFQHSAQLKWIAPRQQLGPVHRTFAQNLVQNRNLILWPSGPIVPSSISGGQIRIEKCVQSGRNHSGLAVVLSENRNWTGQFMLFTGDARYSAIPSGKSGTFSSVVVPHHGADMRNMFAPVCPGNPHNRLAYSFGDPNSYGHPRPITETHHQRSGWNHSAPPGTSGTKHVRRTIDGRSNGLGHIELHWQLMNSPVGVPCHGAFCSLGAAQI